MYTPKFSLSFTLLFSFLFIMLQSLADISTMLIYARHSTRYTYTFFSYATCEWPEIFIQNKVLFCSVQKLKLGEFVGNMGPFGNMIHQEENEYMYIIHAQMILESKCILTEISITPSLSPTIYKFETYLKDL